MWVSHAHTGALPDVLTMHWVLAMVMHESAHMHLCKQVHRTMHCILPSAAHIVMCKETHRSMQQQPDGRWVDVA